MSTLVEQLSNCYDYFLKLSGNKVKEIIITVKTVTLCKISFIFFLKKRLALTSFYYLSQEIWLGDPWKLICRDQLRLTPGAIQKCLRWLGLKLIQLEQQKTQLPFIILAKNLCSAGPLKVHKIFLTGNK